MTSCCTIWIQIKTTTYLKWLFAKSYSVILRNFTIFSTVLPNHIFPLMQWATLQNRTLIVFCTNFNIVNVVPNCAMSFWTYWSSSSSSTIFFKTANNKMKTGWMNFITYEQNARHNVIAWLNSVAVAGSMLAGMLTSLCTCSLTLNIGTIVRVLHSNFTYFCDFDCIWALAHSNIKYSVPKSVIWDTPHQ